MEHQVFTPQSVTELLARMDELREHALPVAGGTDVLLQLRQGRRAPGHLVSLRRAGLADIHEGGDHIEIGAAAPLAAVATHPAVLTWAPVLADACRQIGGPQVQAMGTLGGNLGNASPCADSAPPLFVLGARVCLRSVANERELPVAAFFVGPGRTARAANEVVTAIRVPLAWAPTALGAGHRRVTLFRKYGARRANVISAVNFAALLDISEGGIVQARCAAGSVAPRPVRLPTVEDWLCGQSLTAAYAATADLERRVAADIAPIDDVRGSLVYKRQLVMNSVRWALWRAIAEAENPE
jgi:xanthine dehydrogenase FAD-binding subunit